MLLKGIDLPEILLRAQEAGELVVFAGAGVSCPPPSNLPLFNDLAQQIGKSSGLTMEKDEPADHYLGRLKHKGIDVHQESARILDEILACSPRTPFERNRSNYTFIISQAVTQRPEWGLQWIEMLVNKNLPDKDLWYCVCQGWRNAKLSPQQWKNILDVVEKINAPPEFFSAFADVLQDGSRKESNALPDDLMEQAEKVAARIWDSALKSSPIEKDTSDDWLGVAINGPGGKLAEFWLQRVSLARKEAGDNWAGIPGEIKGGLLKILHGTSGDAAYARVVFASQLHYFFSLDTSFAMTEIFPLFNWQTDELRAEQCWHGFLFWGRWLAGFTEQLLPYFTDTISRIQKMSDRVREGLIYQIAGVTLFRIENPLANDWFPNVILKLSDKDLTQLAATIDRYLGDVEPSVTEKIWEKWLAEYWKMRLINKPKVIVPGEGNEMGCWSFSLGRYFPDAVKLTASMKGIVTFEHTPIFLRLDEKKELIRNYPDATADLVLFYLQCPLKYFFNNEQVKSVWQELRQLSVDGEKLKKIREELFRRDADPGPP